LVYARFVRHRSAAVLLIESGAVRVNRNRVTKVATAVKTGDVVTLALHGDVKVLRVLGETERRGPAQLAQELYRELDKKEDATAEAIC
jgi:ribosome-associated heat shock protein Hsp15